MKALLLPYLVVGLLLAGLWLRGPVSLTGVRVEGESTGERTVAFTERVPSTAPAYTPTPQPGLSIVLGTGETAHSLTVEQIRALWVFPAEQEYVAARTAVCESGFDPAMHVIDSDGLPRDGAWSVGATWWGAVPPTLAAQAIQVSGIVAEQGWRPFTASVGCREWSR